MEIWITQLIPAKFIALSGPFSLLLAGYFVERYYVGRVSLFLKCFCIDNLFL